MYSLFKCTSSSMFFILFHSLLGILEPDDASSLTFIEGKFKFITHKDLASSQPQEQKAVVVSLLTVFAYWN